MKTLILLRHAKSSWDDPLLTDHDRPLNDRGRRAAPVMARWIRSKGYLADAIVTSSAQRTRETVALLRQELAELPAPLVEEALYHASAETLLRVAQDLPETAATALIVGHQPGLSLFAEALTGGQTPAHCKAAFAHFPTAAAAAFQIPSAAWRDLAHGTGRFMDFAKPRDLAKR